MLGRRLWDEVKDELPPLTDFATSLDGWPETESAYCCISAAELLRGSPAAFD